MALFNPVVQALRLDAPFLSISQCAMKQALSYVEFIPLIRDVSSIKNLKLDFATILNSSVAVSKEGHRAQFHLVVPRPTQDLNSRLCGTKWHTQAT